MVFWFQFSTEKKKTNYPDSTNIQRRTMNPVSNFNLGKNSLLHQNRSPHCVFIFDLAPLWRLYAALEMYDQWWLGYFPNYQTKCISQSCAFLLVSTQLFLSSVSKKYDQKKKTKQQRYVNCYIEGFFFRLQVQITTLCISISLSATVALVCLFTPKMYIIVFQPEKNVRRLTMNSASYKKPVTNTSSVLGANNHGNVKTIVHFCQWYSQAITSQYRLAYYKLSTAHCFFACQKILRFIFDIRCDWGAKIS